MTKQYLQSSLMALVTATLLVGCGGSSEETSNNTNQEVNNGTTEIEVERGKVYQATVKDSSTPAQTATQTENSNIYTFSKKPTMPIIATGGWIDVDGDGNMSDSDIENDFNLSSYSYVVTPLTTYLGDTNSTEGKAKVEQLLTDMNISKEDLNKVPSKSTTSGIAIQNALYKVMKTKGSTLLTSDDLDDVNSSFNEIKEAIAQRPDLVDVSAIAKFAEQDIVDVLKNSGHAKALSNDKINFFKDALKYIDGNQSLEEELEELKKVDTSVENQNLSKHNYISIFHNITLDERNRILTAVTDGTGTSKYYPAGEGGDIMGDSLTYYDLTRETTCVSIGGFYDEEGQVTTTQENGITKKVYRLHDKNHEAYCTEYIYSDTSDVYGELDYAVSYHKQDLNSEDIFINKSTTLTTNDLNYDGYVYIAPQTYDSTCTNENQYYVETGSYSCNDFTQTSNCQVNGITYGGSGDCITLSSDSYNGSTK